MAMMPQSNNTLLINGAFNNILDMDKYVKFNSQQDFDTAHEAAITEAGLPIVGCVNGVLAPKNQQTTKITISIPHPSDGTVIARIPKLWPENKKAGFDDKTKVEFSEYFPDPENKKTKI